MVVNVTGKFSSFLSTSAPSGAQPIFEIDAPMITATGQTSKPVAISVDAATIAKDQLAAPGAEPYKGSYVTVTGASFPASSIAALEFSMSCSDQSMPAQMGTTFGGFEPCAGVAMPLHEPAHRERDVHRAQRDRGARVQLQRHAVLAGVADGGRRHAALVVAVRSVHT